MELNEHIYPDSRIRDVMRHPAFDGKGRLLFPWDEPERYQDDMTMMDVPQMNLWHTNQDVNEMVGGVNRMIDDRADGKQVLFDIYSEEELAADSSKRNTGLFFFRGKPGMPFAVVCAGGGFCYVGSLHEGFPVAMEINRSGYNAFVLKYRTNCRGKDSSEDLLRAVRFIRDHAKELEVDSENYSLWGGSAGARLCSYVTYLGSGFIKPGRKLHPAADIIAYTYFDFKPRFMPEDSPGFFITGTRDWLVPVSSTRADADGLRKQGVPVEVHAPEGAEHGFGVGSGTPAEGWISQAIDFWERNMKK